MSENVKSIFKRALAHYVRELKKLQEDKDLEFSNDIFNVSIQGKIDKIDDIIRGLDSPLIHDTLEPNRELLCHVLQSYIEGLEKMKDLINSKLQSSDPSFRLSHLPTLKTK